MYRLFNNTSGYYLPAFLCIQLNDKIDTQNFENHTDEVKGTFIHEYCHFLQDVSTTYGYSNFICFIQEFLYKIRREKVESDKKILEYNRDFHNLHYGDNEIEDDMFLISKVEVVEDEICKELYPQDTVEKVMVKYNLSKEFQFGNCCIMESMAYLVEKRLYKVRRRENEFPYNVCEEICKHEYAAFARNEIWIMALCELALLELDSGVFFIKALRLMKEKKFIPATVNDIQVFIDKNFTIGFRGKKDKIELLLSEVYPDCGLDFSKIKEWIVKRFEIGCDYREISKCFISLSLCSEDAGVRFGIWNTLMRDFGCPVLIDSDGNRIEGAYLGQEEIDISFMLAPMAIDKLLDRNGLHIIEECPLIPLCLSAGDSLYSDTCRKDLTKDINNRELLCVVKWFWKMYQLDRD